MNNLIFDTDCDLQYTLSENYPKTTKYFVAERRYYDRWNLHPDYDYDPIGGFYRCRHADWERYCRQIYDHEWLEEYMAEYGGLPLRIVECTAEGAIRTWTIDNYGPTGTREYIATPCMQEKCIVEACDKAGLINILY